MAVVVVMVGQCGNQLGDELFTQLSLCTPGGVAAPSPKAPAEARRTSLPAATRSPFFARDGKARCVLVDTEPKVVQGVRQRHADFIRDENVVHGQSGRGNNWGLGYYGVRTADSKRTEGNAAVQRAFRNMGRDQREADDNVLGKALQAIYRETRRTSDMDDEVEEEQDGFEAILVLHSLVGGTGSGLASKLTERVRLYFTAPAAGQEVDEVYEEKMMRYDGFDGRLYGPQRRARHLVNISVAPQALGEVATQGLNAALTLQVLQRHADAVLLLRNDDAMAPGESSGSSVCAGLSILSRCVTFKEANETLVALLLPVLRYGMRTGCVARLVAQCVPPGFERTTGGNKILTLVPAPQRSYATMRQCAHRGMFFVVNGGRAFMPGYVPTVPIEEVLSRTALRLSGGASAIRAESQRGGGGAGASGHGATRNDLTSRRLSDANTRGRQSPNMSGLVVNGVGGMSAGAAAAAASSAAGLGARRLQQQRQQQSASAFSASPPQSPPRTRLRGSGENVRGIASTALSPLRNGAFPHGGSGETDDIDRRVYTEGATRIPHDLYRHYLQLRRAPVTKLFEELDGVLVLNQVAELNRRLLFPLLRSAALKVSSGAFMSSYEDVGVKSERVQRAYREVAEVLANSEEM